MTTYVPFLPTATAPFSFTALLDGAQYGVIVTWNIFEQRWFVNIYASNNVLSLAIPMIGSPPPLPLAAPGSFPLPLLPQVTTPGASGLTWYAGVATAVAAAPHGYTVGSVQDLTISAVPPDTSGGGFYGAFECIITSPTAFTYPLIIEPAPGTPDSQYAATVPSSAISWRAAGTDFLALSVPTGNESPFSGTVAATTLYALPYRPGSVVNFTIAGVNPSGYNGKYPCYVTTPNTFVYYLPDNPGPPVGVTGTYSLDTSLTAGYFNSTMIWRPSSGNFEVSP